MDSEIKQKQLANISGIWSCDKQRALHEMNFKVTKPEDISKLDLVDQYNGLKDECKGSSLEMITPLVAETQMVVAENMKIFGSS